MLELVTQLSNVFQRKLEYKIYARLFCPNEGHILILSLYALCSLILVVQICSEFSLYHFGQSKPVGLQQVKNSSIVHGLNDVCYIVTTKFHTAFNFNTAQASA